MLTVGDKFPSFSLRAAITAESDPEKAFRTVTDLDYPGKWKVYFFWPKDFGLICPTEVAEFSRQSKQFEERDAQLLGGSIDSEFAHRAWRQSDPAIRDAPFPMLADIKRELATQLGILDPNEGTPRRATFVVDPDGIIRFVYVTDFRLGRSPEEVLRVLDALQSKQLCPAEWRKGQATLEAA